MVLFVFFFLRPTTRTNSLQMDDTHCAGGGLSTESDEKPSKPMLVHGESDFSDHTKDLQMNQIRQVHQDTIHKPNMLLMGDRSDSPTSNKNSLWLNNEISELMTVSIIDISYQWILYFFYWKFVVNNYLSSYLTSNQKSNF